MEKQYTDSFIIPVGEYFNIENNSVFIFYNPFSEVIALIDHEFKNELESYFKKGVIPASDEAKSFIDELSVPDKMRFDLPALGKIKKMSVIPNLICNFKCSYCYSAQGRSSTIIKWECLKTALDFFVDNKRIALDSDNDKLSLFISGGGEPLMSWNVTSRCIEYAKRKSDSEGLGLNISLITNGSLLNRNIIAFLKEYECNVCISFEVLEDLQNEQRKSFDIVDKNIKLLKETGVNTMLNSTITPLSVGRMVEMVNRVVAEYPFVAQYTLEPVTGISMFSTPSDMRDFYMQFMDNYLKAKTVAMDNGLKLRFTFDDALRDITVRHCPGKFCVTPQGTISICHLVSSPKEDRYDGCIYGRINDSGEIIIDYDKYNSLRNKNVFYYKRCEDCFAKWSCGGECMTRNETYPEEYMEEVCSFNKRFLLHQLLTKIEDDVKDEYGVTLKEYVDSWN